MGRNERINVAGATYHVMNRGNRKARIFEDDRDRKRFNRLLLEAMEKYEVELLLQSQMGTHFHAIVTTPHGNLSDFMCDWEGEFARYSNWRHGRVGHVFQGRFVGVLIEDDIQLFIAASYVFNNPVVAGFVRRPEDWKWSTYAATVGLSARPRELSLSWVETLFPSSSFTDSQAMLRGCVNSADPVLSYLDVVDPTSQLALRSYIAERLRGIELPGCYRTLLRPPLDHLFVHGQTRDERAATIQVAHQTYGYTLAEIARCLRLHPGHVSKIYCSHRRAHRR